MDKMIENMFVKRKKKMIFWRYVIGIGSGFSNCYFCLY